MVHQPVSRGLAVFADAWLSGWLAEISADLTGNGSASEVVSRRCAIQIHDFFLTTDWVSGSNYVTGSHTVAAPDCQSWGGQRGARDS